MRSVEKKLRKAYLGDEGCKDTFHRPTALWEKEDWNKLLDFKRYCFELQRCLQCGSRYSDAVKQKDTFNLILQCENCLSNDVLSDSVSQDYVRWLDDMVKNNGGSTFEDGFPVIPKFEVDYTCERKKVKV